MQAARRLYLYAMAGVALAVISFGLVMLLEVLLDSVAALRRPGDAFGYGGFGRNQVSQAIAMLGVGIPVWAVHWWLAQRGLRPGRPGRDAERNSSLRALYLSIVLLVALVVWVYSATISVEYFALNAIGVPADEIYIDPVSSLPLLVVGLVVWLYHGLVRRRDLAAGPVEGDAAWLPRLYLYGVALGALIAAVFELQGLIRTIGFTAPSGAPENYVARSVIDNLADVLAWGLVWLGHWRYTSGLVSGNSPRSADERVSRVRVVAFLATITIAAGFAVTEAAGVVAGLLRLALPVPAFSNPPNPLQAFIVNVLALLPWAAAWYLHDRWLRREPASADGLRALHVARLRSHALAALGLLIGATALGWLLGFGLDVALGGTRRQDDFTSYELMRWIPMAALGGGLWLAAWGRVRARRHAAPVEEASSAIRRTFLYLTLAGAVIVSIGSATVVLYRLVGTLLGANLSGNPVSELSTPFGSLVMALLVITYHGLALRRDQRLMAEQAPAAPSDLEAPPPVAPPGARRTLTLVAPEGADLGAAVASVRAALPAGFELVEEGGGAGG